MEKFADTDTRLVATPSKPSARGEDSDEDYSEGSSMSSPTPFSAFLARKSPPALSIKRRKGTGLFAESPGPGSAKLIDDVGSALSVRRDDKQAEIVCGGGDDDGKGPPLIGGSDRGTASLRLDRTSSRSGTDCFASPERRPPCEDLLGSSRITPQRNLGGLFVSPVAAPRERLGDREPFPTPRLPPPLHSPGQEKLAEGAPARDAGCVETPSAALVSADACTDDQPIGSRDVLEEDGETTTVPGKNDEDTEVTGSVCVSNEALSSQPLEALCTLEVLVKHTRERVGVSALSSWRVAELKKRLVYLSIFARPEVITLTPRYEDESLKDDISLATLDTEVTYEARAVSVS